MYFSQSERDNRLLSAVFKNLIEAHIVQYSSKLCTVTMPIYNKIE